MAIKINEFIGTIFQQGQSIKESEERFLSIADSASMAMIVAVDMDGRVIFWNRAAEKLFGYKKREIVGQPIIKIIPERFRAAHLTAFERARHSKETDKLGKPVELTGLHRNGIEFPIELSLGVWVQEGQKYFSGVIHNISERKIEEEALIRAKEEAEEANKTKTDFLANMSHELRTPLNGILGFSQMMIDQVFGNLGHDKNMTYVKDINHAGQHLLRLVNEILDVSKIEAGQLTLAETQVDVKNVVTSCAKIAGERLSEAELELTTDIDADLPLLLADETRIEQILNNLLSNAIKFTPSGGTIGIEAKMNDEGEMVLRVTDTGIGIEENNIPKILQPFEQVENIMTRSHEGSGLGLPLVKHLAEMQGGSMQITSKLDHGTTVRVSFSSDKIVS